MRRLYFFPCHALSVEKVINEAVALIRRGYNEKVVKERISSMGFDADEVYELAKCRIRMKDKFSVKNLYFDSYGLRYSTPEIIGVYRAGRIRDMRIADISCGVGMQAIFFARTNQEVLCLDIDKRRINYAIKNAEAYGVKNIRFEVGDCFSEFIHSLAKDYDIIYSDPARSEFEKERSLKNLMPSPLKIIEKYGERNYVFDLPPQISQDKIPSGWEKEYISLYGKIRRLTAYVGELYEHDRKAVSLPAGEAIYTDEHYSFTKKLEFSDYIYIVDESIYYADLMGALEKKYPIWFIQTGKRRTFASSRTLLRSAFLRAFKVLYFSDDMEEILRFLRDENFGKVTLRFNVDPAKYWNIRKRFERNLTGSEKVSLFKIGTMYVVGTECNIT